MPENMENIRNDITCIREVVARHGEKIKAMATTIEELKETMAEHSKTTSQAMQTIEQCNSSQDLRHAKITAQVSSALRIAKWLIGIATAVLTAYLVSLVS